MSTILDCHPDFLSALKSSPIDLHMFDLMAHEGYARTENIFRATSFDKSKEIREMIVADLIGFMVLTMDVYLDKNSYLFKTDAISSTVQLGLNSGAISSCARIQDSASLASVWNVSDS